MQDLLKLGAIIVSILTQIAFFTALVVAYYSKDSQNLALLIGAVIANSTTSVSYWLGSSSGSAKKTDLLALSPAISNADLAVASSANVSGSSSSLHTAAPL